MKWRCTWCGKPHESDDPPCDECGHHKFEKAIEQVNAATADGQAPVWVCTDCGREHQKHSPPCSRCGHVDLEKRQPDYSDLEDLGGTSYLDVLEPKYALGYAVVAVLGVYLALGLAGVVALPALDGGPAPPDADGYDESVEGLSLADVETAYVTQANDRRRAGGDAALTRNQRLTRIATYYNKRWVDSVYGDGESPTVEGLGSQFDVPCRASLFADDVGTEIDGEGTDAYADEAALAAAVSVGDGGPPTDSSFDEVGVDVHVAPDGRAFVTALLC